MTYETVRANIAGGLLGVLNRGLQPCRALVGVKAYRVLVERDGLEPRSIGRINPTSLRFRLLDVDLPVDCDKSIKPGEEFVTALAVETGRA